MWKDEGTAADVLLAAQDIQRFTTGMSYEDFLIERQDSSRCGSAHHRHG